MYMSNIFALLYPSYMIIHALAHNPAGVGMGLGNIVEHTHVGFSG